MNPYALPGLDSAKHWVSIIANTVGISVETIKSNSRETPLPDVRKLISYLLRDRYSLSMIGKEINRDHASVLSAKRKFIDLMETDKAFKRTYAPIVRTIEIQMNMKNPTNDVYVKCPIEVNNGWVAADVHNVGFGIHIEEYVCSTKEEAVLKCDSHNKKYFNDSEVAAVLKANSMNAVVLQDPSKRATALVDAYLKPIVGKELDGRDVNKMEVALHNEFDGLAKIHAAANMELALLRNKLDTIVGKLSATKPVTDNERLLVDDLQNVIRAYND